VKKERSESGKGRAAAGPEGSAAAPGRQARASRLTMAKGSRFTTITRSIQRRPHQARDKSKGYVERTAETTNGRLIAKARKERKRETTAEGTEKVNDG